MMNRKVGSLRHPNSGPCPLRSSSALSPSSTFVDADSASHAYEVLWKYHSIEADADLTAQHIERPPILAAPKLVLRPLAPAVGAPEPKHILQKSEEEDERHPLHTDVSRFYGPAHHDMADPPAEWGLGQKLARSAAKRIPTAARRVPGQAAVVSVPQQRIYDIPYDNVDLAAQIGRCGPPAHRLTGMAMCPKTTQVPGPKRPPYGRVLLQRLAAPVDGDVPYVQSRSYLDKYTLDSRDDRSSQPPLQPQERQPLYGIFQDVVPRNAYGGRPAPSPSHVPDRPQAALRKADDIQGKGQAKPQPVCSEELLTWPWEVSTEPAVVVAAEHATHAAVPKAEPQAAIPAGDLEASRPEALTLSSLEALAEVACRAAELLDQENEDQEAFEGAEAEAAEASSMSLDSGHSRRGREAEEWNHGDGASRGKRRAVAAVAAVLPRSVLKKQQQQQQQQRQRQVLATPLELRLGASTSALAGGGAGPSSPTGNGPSLALPLTVFHLDRKCPKVLAPRSGKLGDTKHLVLPGEIVQALPGEMCSGVRPILVEALVSAAPATNTDVFQPQHALLLQRCNIECQIGNGPGGFPALHLPVSEEVYGRPVRRFTLREDLVLELELGDPVVKPSRGNSRKRGVDESSSNTSDEESDEDEDVTLCGAGTAAGGGRAAVTAAAITTTVGDSPTEVCFSRVKDGFVGFRRGIKEEAATAIEPSWKIPEEDEEVAALIRTPDMAGAMKEEGMIVGTGSGSNVSEDTGVALGTIAPLSAAAMAIGTTEPTQTVGQAGTGASGVGRGGRWRSGTAATLPIVIRRPASSKPTVMRSCTGAVGSKKHLPLPSNIIKALPHPQRTGAAPVDVLITYQTTGSETAAPLEEHLSCFVGPTGSHGCTALQVPVSHSMNGRRLLHITLRTDLKLELGLCERIDIPGASAQGQEKSAAAAVAAAAAAAQSGGGDVDDDDAFEVTADGEALPALPPAARRQHGTGGGSGAALDGGYSVAGPRYKRRRSSSVSPCDSAIAADTAAIVRAATTTLLPQPSLLAVGPLPARCGNQIDEKADVADQDAFKELLAMAAKAGLPVEALEALQQQLLVQQRHGQHAPLPPVPLLPHPQQYHLQLQPLYQPVRHRQPLPGAAVGAPGGLATTTAAVARAPPLQWPQLTPSPVTSYGMLPYMQTSITAGQHGNFASVESTVSVARRMASAAPPRLQGSLDPHSRHARHPHYHAAAAAAAAAAAMAPTTADEKSQAAFAAAETLARALGLLQQVPRAQQTAARALAQAATQSEGAAEMEGGTVLSNFRSCLAGIVGLLTRAREAVLSDLATQLDDQNSDDLVTNGSVYEDLLAAAPAMLNASECLLEWYGLLAAAQDERTAVSYATELAGSAALVKAQLAHELAPLAVLVRP